MPRKANKYSPTQLAEWRQRINVAQAIDTINDTVEGKIEPSTARMKACEIALRKTLPDLTNVELKADLEGVTYTWAPAIKDITPDKGQNSGILEGNRAVLEVAGDGDEGAQTAIFPAPENRDKETAENSQS